MTKETIIVATKNMRLISTVKKWSERKIDDVSIKREISYDSVSFWWFIESIIYNLLQAKTTKRVKFLDNILIKLFDLFIIFSFFIRSVISKILFKDLSFDENSKPKILAISYSFNWRKVVDIKTLKIINGDLMLGYPIQKLLDNGCSVIGLQAGSQHNLNIDKLFSLRFSHQTTWTPVERYFTFGLILRSLRLERSLLKTFDKKFSFLNDDYLKSEVKKYLVFKSIQMFLFIEALKKYIEEKKPDAILITAEEGSLGRAAVFSGKFKDVPTFAILHGVISKGNLAYYHPKNEIASNKNFVDKCPLPDKTAVFGPYFKKTLIDECNYPLDSVVVTGQPRYDMLPRIKNTFDKKKFCKKYNLDFNKKIVLILDEPPREFLLGNVKELSKIDDIEIVVKPHPSLSDVKSEKKLVSQIDAKVTFLDRYDVIYESLAAADLVITMTSTSLLEAIALRKPVLIANFTRERDIAEYEKNKATIVIYDKKRLLPIITKIFEDKKFAGKLLRMNDLFLKKYCLIDGKSSDRVADEIFELVKKGR